ncbi:MAG: aldo/keto reductase [Desulfosarcina sp.]|nr:aldo/keto reductase [Desulfosarcina sp.]
MQKRYVGNSDIEIAPLAFGGNVFGWTADEATSFKLLDAFVEAGFNFIDTADTYSHWAPDNKGGESETTIGKWLQRLQTDLYRSVPVYVDDAQPPWKRPLKPMTKGGPAVCLDTHHSGPGLVDRSTGGHRPDRQCNQPGAVAGTGQGDNRRTG